MCIVGCAAALGIWPGRAAPENPLPQVSAFLHDEHVVPGMTLIAAQSLASEIMRQASVRLEWRQGSPPAQPCGPTNDRVVVIVFQRSDQGSDAFRSALAYTHPFAKSPAKIIINYDMLGSFGSARIKWTSQLLAHLIAHEVTHVIERIDRHSESGLMKAHWTTHDYAEMTHHSLPFAPDDLVLIPLGLAAWRRENCFEEVGPGTFANRRAH